MKVYMADFHVFHINFQIKLTAPINNALAVSMKSHLSILLGTFANLALGGQINL